MRLLISLPLFFLYWSCWCDVAVDAFAPLPQQLPVLVRHHAHDDPTQNWLDQAARLRQEALEMESQRKMVEEPRCRDPVTPVISISGQPWTLSYNFATLPDSRLVLRGKFVVSFQEDGYTQLVDAEPGTTTAHEISKVWGWDAERSSEDSLEYLLFSIDISYQETSDESATASTTARRYYFQGRVDDTGGGLELADGTVTVKQNLVETKEAEKNGFWQSLLSPPAGILARFTYVGNFVAKPTQQ